MELAQIGLHVKRWIRDNYGWRAKKAEWATLAFGLLLIAAIAATVVAAVQ